jgi:hypothetical protein
MSVGRAQQVLDSGVENRFLKTPLQLATTRFSIMITNLNFLLAGANARGLTSLKHVLKERLNNKNKVTCYSRRYVNHDSASSTFESNLLS